MVVTVCSLMWPLAAARGGGPGDLVRALFLPAEQPLLLGSGVDLMGTVWTFDFVQRLLDGTASTFNPDVFAPLGWDQGAAQARAWLDAIMAWPLVQIMGIPGFYDLHVMMVLLLSQFSIYLLCIQAGAPWPLALGLSVLGIRNPFVMGQIYEGRPTQVHLVFHALFLLALLHLPGWPSSSSGGLRNPEPVPMGRVLLAGTLAGLMLAAACFVYWFGALAVGMMAALAVVLQSFLFGRKCGPLLAGSAVAGATALLVAFLVAPGLVGNVLAGDGATWIPDLASPPSWQVDLGFASLPLRGQPQVQVHGLWTAIQALQSLGLPLCLVAAGLGMVLLPGRRRVLAWGLASLFFLSMPMGPMVQVGDRVLVSAMGMAQWIFPPMARCHHPDRTVVAPLLGLMVAVSLGFRALLLRWAPSRNMGLLASALLGMASVGWALAGPSSSELGSTTVFDGGDFYTSVARRWPGGMIHVPLWTSNEEYAWQVLHRQPLLGGPGIRGHNTRPPGHRAYCESNSFLAALEELALHGEGALPVYRPADLRRLLDDGFSVLVVHGQHVESGPQRFRRFLGEPGWRHSLLTAYPLSGVSAQEPTTSAPAPEAQATSTR